MTCVSTLTLKSTEVEVDFVVNGCVVSEVSSSSSGCFSLSIFPFLFLVFFFFFVSFSYYYVFFFFLSSFSFSCPFFFFLLHCSTFRLEMRDLKFQEPYLVLLQEKLTPTSAASAENSTGNCPTSLPFPTLPCLFHPALPYPTLPYPARPCIALPYPTLPHSTQHTAHKTVSRLSWGGRGLCRWNGWRSSSWWRRGDQAYIYICVYVYIYIDIYIDFLTIYMYMSK